MRSLRCVWMVLVAMLLTAGYAAGQNYPNRLIRIYTGDVGAGADLPSRLVAQGISGPLGQQVIVENRSGIIAIEVVAKAPADGYSLLLYGTMIWLTPLLRDNVSWDAIRDFVPITLAVSMPNIVVVNPSVPAKSLTELIALAKARPGALSYASTGAGGTPQLAAELFKSMAAVDILGVTYKAIATALNDVIGGRVQMIFASAGSVAAHTQAGRLRALAVTSAQPSVLAPGLPTVAASGLPGYESVSILGVLAPAKTPAAIISRLNEEMVKVLHKPEVKEKLFTTGVEVVGSSPEGFAAAIKSDIAVWGKVIKDAGIRAE